MPDALTYLDRPTRPAPKFTAGDRVVPVSSRDTGSAFTVDSIDWIEPHAGRPGFWCVSGSDGACRTMGSEKLYRLIADSDPEPVAESSYRHLVWPYGNSFEGRR